MFFVIFVFRRWIFFTISQIVHNAFVKCISGEKYSGVASVMAYVDICHITSLMKVFHQPVFNNFILKDICC